MLLLVFMSIILIVGLIIWFKVDGASAIGGSLLSLLGTLAGCVKDAFSWEFGSSRGSADKTALLAGSNGGGK